MKAEMNILCDYNMYTCMKYVCAKEEIMFYGLPWFIAYRKGRILW